MQSNQHETKDLKTKNGYFKAKVLDLLVAGHTQASTTKILKRPKQNINRIVRELEKKGIIESYTRYPKLYRLKLKVTNPLRGGDKVTNPLTRNMSLWIPHKFGASFTINKGKLNFNFDSRGKKIIKRTDHTAIFTSRNTLIIWLKEVYLGQNPYEIIDNAKVAFEKIALLYELKYNIQTSLIRIYDGVEWTSTSEEVSTTMANNLDIQRYEQKEVGDIIIKNGDSTHSEIELNQAPQKPPDKPTRQAKALHQIEKHLETLEFLTEKAPSLLKQQTEAIDKLADATIVLNQKIIEIKKD